MKQGFKRLHHRRDAKEQLAKINNNRNNVVVIHYSCESFYDRPNGTSPRITSIAINNLAAGQTISFSIHQLAERDKKFSVESINQHYDEFEKNMLKEFFDYAKNHQSYVWVHWNMRNINYGFAALEHRYKVLGGDPFEIPESQRCDLSRLLVGLYGDGYISHPRLESLVKKNCMSTLNFLNGKAESKAFDNGEYVKLHQSTLRKVDVLSHIIDLTSDNTLKTNARLTEIYGDYFALATGKIREHWLFSLIGIIGAVASIAALVLYLF